MGQPHTFYDALAKIPNKLQSEEGFVEQFTIAERYGKLLDP
jgi:hypothetical protein